MRWIGRTSVLAAVIAAGLFGVASQAEAAPPHNVGWLYTQGGSGAVFFDADLAGYPSYEKITVCDNKSDGRGIIAKVLPADPFSTDGEVILRDPSNNGHCEAQWANYFADGYQVIVEVCEYWGTHEDNCVQSTGVA